MAKPIRSILFAPANQHELLKKTPRANADVTIACLEDGTPVDEKESARAALTGVFGEMRATGWSGRMFVRVNNRGSQWFADDIRCAIDGGFDGIVVPKVESAADLEELHAVMDAQNDARAREMDVIAGMETGRGIINIESIFEAGRNLIGAYFGAEDFATSINGVRSASNVEVLYARSRVAIHAKVRGMSVFDCGTLAFKDDERFRRECAEARGMGYTGKICLHPRQAELANELFRPTDEEAEWCRRLLAEYNQSLAEGRATPAIDGKMIDGPLVKRAEAILALYED
jgi:citrate lyase subunit beta / citryl-CoA lyase